MNNELSIHPVAAQPSVPGLEGFVRLSGSPQEVADSLGPLADLVGTWVGNHGWNLIAVPSYNQESKISGFQLLIRPYIETITFSSLGAKVPDRGGEVGTLMLTGVQYDLRITDAETNQPLHFENGMWLFLNQNPQPGTPEPTIYRHAVIPHGNSLAAFGNYTISEGAPQIPDINTVPEIGHPTQDGYLDPYIGPPIPGFDTSNPNKVLQQVISQQNILQTTTLNVSTQNNGGGIINIPFVTAHANATAFNGTFWIEKVESEGTVFEQLQYSQQTNLEFLQVFGQPDPAKLIMWPHVNINTLVKQ